MVGPPVANMEERELAAAGSSNSGLGREGCAEGIQEFLETKYIAVATWWCETESRCVP